MEGYTKLKDKGNDLFKEKKFEESIAAFETAIAQLEKNEPAAAITDSTEVGKIFVILNINAAFAALNLKSRPYYLKAQQLCTKALNVDRKNQKALYRRGLAYKECAELIELETNGTAPELIELYNKAKADLEDLVVLDKNNDLAKQKLTQTVKDIYRITVQQGKEVNLSSQTKVQTKVVNKVEERKEVPAPKAPKRGGDMNKIMEEYKIEVVTSMAREKVEHQYLTQELPKTKSELEKALREIQKSQDVCLRFIYRFTEDYLKKIQPNFDMLIQILGIVLKKGEGEEAKNVLLAVRAQKAFDLMWKSYSSGEKKQFREGWISLGLPEEQLP